LGEDNTIVDTEQSKSLDKMQIALMIKDSTFGFKPSCSLLEKAILSSCNVCNLRSICEGVEIVAQDYVDETTKVVSSFSFQ